MFVIMRDGMYLTWWIDGYVWGRNLVGAMEWEDEADAAVVAEAVGGSVVYVD